jgi:hypothetical protein
MSSKIIHNVKDARRMRINSWETTPLVYNDLCPEDIGSTVIYQDYGKAQAGTITSYRDGFVFARYSRDDTAAGALPNKLCFGVRVVVND